MILIFKKKQILQTEMYQNIKPFYSNNDISQRKEQYYDQVLYHKTRNITPYFPQQSQLTSVQIDNNIPLQDNKKSFDTSQINQFKPFSSLNHQSRVSPSKLPNFDSKTLIKSKVIKLLINTDPQRHKVLQQRSQLFHKLQIVTLGLPIQQNKKQTQLLSKKYILQHYKSEEVTQIKQQQKKIKLLTAQMMENQKVIARISKVSNSLIDRINRIKKIDQEIYSNLDQDKTQQIEGYLKIAKNLLAEGENQEKIIAVLRKALH